MKLQTHGIPVIVEDDKTTYESEENRVSHKQFTTEFIGLPAFKIDKILKEIDGRWVADLKPKQTESHCPICKKLSTNHSRSEHRTLRHRFTPGWGNLFVRVPVYRQRCDDCGLTWTVEWPEIPPGRTKATQPFIDAAVKACQRRDIKSVAKEWGLAYTTLERWYYIAAPKLVPKPKHHKPPIIVCMDEFAVKRGHKYCIALMDHTSGHVWQISPGRSRKDIQCSLRNWPFAAPAVVVTDLAPGMSETVHQIWPGSQVVIDKFHVLSLLFHRINNQRKMAHDNPTKHKSIGHRQKLLTREPEKLTMEQRDKLKILLANDWKLSALYEALQGLRYVYKSKNIEEGTTRFQQWLTKYLTDSCGAVRSIVKTLIKWKEEFLAYFTFRVTNAPMEGTNNLIKTLKRRAYGYRNMERFSLRIRLECQALSTNVNINETNETLKQVA